jgi:hypothetical protein
VAFKLSVSSADCWQACPRKFYFRYQMRREPCDEAAELVFGKAWHSFRDGQPNTRSLEGAELLKLRVMNECYVKHWKDRPLDILAYEEEFSLPAFDGNRLDPDIHVHGRIDARNASCLIEYKTTSSYIDAGSVYWERVLDDRQIQTYLGALWSAGHTYNEVLYDVARKPMIKRKAKESLEDYGKRLHETIEADPGAYFQRRTFTFTEEQVADTWRDLYTVATQIPGTPEKADYPKAPRSCWAYGRACEYLDVCRGNESIDNDRLFRIRKSSG